MFLNKPNEKIQITEHLLNFIRSESKKVNLSANEISKKTQHSDSWLSTIYTRKIQSITHKNLIAIFSVILCCDCEEADKYLMENLENLLVNSPSPKNSSNNDNKLGIFPDYPNQLNKNEQLKKEYIKNLKLLKKDVDSFLDDVQIKNNVIAEIVDILRRNGLIVLLSNKKQL